MIRQVVAHEWTSDLQSSVILEIVPYVYRVAVAGGIGGGTPSQHVRRTNQLRLTLDGQSEETTPVVVDVYCADALPIGDEGAAAAGASVRRADIESIIASSPQSLFGDPSSQNKERNKHTRPASGASWRFLRTISFVEPLHPDDHIVNHVALREAPSPLLMGRHHTLQSCATVEVTDGARYLKLDMKGVLRRLEEAVEIAMSPSRSAMFGNTPARSRIEQHHRDDHTHHSAASHNYLHHSARRGGDIGADRALFTPQRNASGAGGQTPPRAATNSPSRHIGTSPRQQQQPSAPLFDKHVVALSVEEFKGGLQGRDQQQQTRGSAVGSQTVGDSSAARGVRRNVGISTTAVPPQPPSPAAPSSHRVRATVGGSGSAPRDAGLNSEGHTSMRMQGASRGGSMYSRAEDHCPQPNNGEAPRPTPPAALARHGLSGGAAVVLDGIVTTPAKEEARQILALRGMIEGQRAQLTALLAEAAAKEQALEGSLGAMAAQMREEHHQHMLARERYLENQRRMLRAMKAAGY